MVMVMVVEYQTLPAAFERNIEIAHDPSFLRSSEQNCSGSSFNCCASPAPSCSEAAAAAERHLKQ
jgi:hypothetical protein